MSNLAASNGSNAEASRQSTSPSSLSYVPYQRRSHARNPSALSQSSPSSSVRGEPSKPNFSGSAPDSGYGAAAQVSALQLGASSIRPSTAMSPSLKAEKPTQESSTASSRLDEPRPSPTTAAAAAPTRGKEGSAARSTPSLPGPLSSSARLPPPPLVRMGAGGSANRGFAAPPPLRTASDWRKHEASAAAAATNSSPKAAGKQPERPERPSQPSQPSAGTIALAQRSASNTSLGQQQAEVRGGEHIRTPSNASVDTAKPMRPKHARTGSRSATLSETNGAGSSRSATPLNSGSASPRLSSSNLQVPAHIHSYAALLAAQSKLGPIPVPQGFAIANAVGIEPGSDVGSAGESAFQAHGRSTAYRPGFQPKGAYRVRTDDFLEARRRRRNEGEMEEQRMERRLAKLVAIHFAPQNDATEEGEKKHAALAPPMLDFDFGELRRDPKAVLRKGGSDLWSSLRARSKGEDLAKRAAEQTIVNWQDDAQVKACPICGSIFSLTVRKHHCRLCGRVVCASPQLSKPAWPDGMAPPGNANKDVARAELQRQLEKKCSSLVVADPATGKIEEARDFKTHLNPVLSAEGAVASNDTKVARAASEKGVRICRDCKSIVRKRQYMIDDGTVPAYLKLYEALKQVQKDIEESLPEFQEMVLGLQKQDHTAALGSSVRANVELQRDAAQARKQLLANFATYDELAKRIRKLPVANNGNSGDAAQERVQQAIWTKANLFLQQNMLPLRSLPKSGSSKSNEPWEGGASDAKEGKARARAGNGNRRGESVGSMASFQTWFGGRGREDGGSRSMTLAEASRLQQDGRYSVDAGEEEDGDGEEGEVDVAALEEQLGVLLEQERLVADYVESASKARKFDDARTLKKSHDDLCAEIERLQRKLVVRGQGRQAIGME
ncbi:carboxypeptidase Y-deficient [Thecaphora frezii]